EHLPEGGARVLAAAVTKQNVREVLDRNGESGIDPRELFASPLVYGAIVDRFLPERKGTFAIVDVGAERTNVAVLRGKHVVLARTISRGGADLTRALAQAYRMPEGDAERLKRERAFAPHEGMRPNHPSHAPMADLVTTRLAPLVRELRQTFALARAETGE